MNESHERWALRAISGEDHSPRAAALRGVLRLAEPFYAAAMSVRNALYDAGFFKSHTLPRPTISVGNITTGGTGKTPVVRWLAERLIENGLRPAILMRGYRAESTGGSDEARMLADHLGGRAIVVANPDRVAGAAYAVTQAPPPPPDAFLLDDAFQHRRVKRDFNLVLIDAAEPLGHGHVLPRGLMREPAHGLRRADAFVITRANAAGESQVEEVRALLQRWNPSAPIFVCDHLHAALRTHEEAVLPIEHLRERKFYAFAGIANAPSVRDQFQAYGRTFGGFRAFPDHHAYTDADVRELYSSAHTAAAEFLVTTEKDWVKVKSLPRNPAMPIVRTELQIRFRDTHGEQLLRRVLDVVTSKSSGSSPPAAPPPGADRAAGT